MDDKLYGNEGADRLKGGLGADLLDGGPDKDRFPKKKDAADTIVADPADA